ncbi:hypothetical protein HKX48_001321 [Thoreauomyces humboldtii]|nr:hypothetical protein HKX48_001321 [Thoreauomyces humboldtii]
MRFLNAQTRKQGDKRPQTHTAFSLAASPRTLHIPGANADTLRLELYRHVHQTRDLASGPNALTEKVPPKGKFRLFLDIAFKIETIRDFLVGKGAQPADRVNLLRNELRKAADAVSLVMDKLTDAPRMILAT